MNKYEESYKRLTSKSYRYASPDSVYEDLEVLRPLVEKSTPKKPVKAEPILARKATRNYCSCCGLRLKKTWKVCPRCETRID